MQISDLNKDLEQLANLANAPKLKRFFHAPYKYTSAILDRMLVYPRNSKAKQVQASTFFGEKMQLLLPASTDIYLTGGKTHTSEIKLAKFMIHHLQEGDSCLDVGAHYGYFSLLAAHLVGENGRVIAFEAAQNTFAILEQNTYLKPNVSALHKAVADKDGTLTFHQFPNLFSEYNSLDIQQYSQQAWFKEEEISKQEVEAVSLSNFLSSSKIEPRFIKIDVEGAEYQIIQGLEKYLRAEPRKIFIAMEYLCKARNNRAHQKAVNLMKQCGFQTHIISEKGYLEPCENADAFLEKTGSESDNVVFALPNF